ncbi:MAG: MFS transporter [Synergistaceae bacterium]|jgi:predicted MFS family arabinose efflux permease|nr:MFS transporter [Synergistaceae bacterium]
MMALPEFRLKIHRRGGNARFFIARIAFALLFLASIAFLIARGGYLFFDHISSVRISSPALAIAAGENSPPVMYVVDFARKRLIFADASGRAYSIINAGKGRFSEIYDLATDASGDIFILDTERDGETRRIKSEVVRRFSSDGRFADEVFRADSDIPAFSRVIAGVSRNEEGGVSFVTLGDGHFVLHSLKPGGSGKTERTHEFPMASLMFNNFDIGGEGQVFFTTRRGEIYSADNKTELIFSPGAQTEGRAAIPWDVAAGIGGEIYFTDLGRRGVYSLGESGESEAVYSDPDTIYYRVSNQNGLVAVSENEVIMPGDGEPRVLEVFEAGGGILALRVCAWLAALICLTGGAWGAVRLARFLVRKNNFVVKFSAAFVVGTLLITAVFCLMVTKDITNRMTREMLSRLTTTAELIAMQIPGEAFARLDSVDDTMGEDYAAVKGLIGKIVNSREDYAGIYCVLYRILDGSISEVFDSDNNHGIVNYPYDWPVEGSDEMEILRAGIPKTYIYPSWVDGGVIFSLCPVYDYAGNPAGLIEIGSDLAAFRRDNRNLILNLFLNVVSMSIALIIIAIELLTFVGARAKMRVSPLRAPSVPVDMMRGAVFLVYFITNMSTSFLPLYARDMILAGSEPILLPLEFMIAVPISADVLMGALASLFGDRIVRKLSIRRAAIAGGVVIVAGLCLEVVSNSIFMLAAGFATCGFGCGLTLFLANLRIAGEEDGAEKDRGFAGLTVATVSGVNGGVVFGAFLLNWLSRRTVLGAAVIVSLALLAFSAKYMTKLNVPSLKRGDNGEKTSAARFLSSPGVASYLLCMLVPAIAAGYFIIYLFPIVGYDHGLPESYIGYSFLLHSLMVILLSSPLTNVFSKKLGKPLSLMLWMLLYAGSFGAFAFFQNIPALLAVLAVIGFADSFGQSLSASYYTDLPEVAEYGYGRAIGVSNVADNAAQTIGPFVFSYALHIGLREGLVRIAVGLAVLSVIFLAGSTRLRSDKE